MSTGAGAILEIDHVDAAYGQAQILFGVSLNLKRGETVALMGRNGAGKSTTLKAVMGLVPARGRAVRFAGHDILGLAPYRIARLGLGYVPEDRRIFTDLTVYENLEVGAKAAIGNGRAAWTPDRLFSIFPNLAEMRGRRASQMSGGEQQMLTIARTLMGNPEAVLLDEPSEGLAPVIVEQMAEAVQRMKAEGIAVLLSEQNLYFAAAVADRSYIIEKGAIRHEGSMAEIQANAALREAYLSV
ncbi:MAG: ABC transporter ATP-binding protein [Hyphomicrobiaceae bacterium]|nr:MAG: ABC transporter ATP-binding protein [Hyphomicrobiaceae bacterium]